MQKNFWARVAAFIRQSHIRKSWRRVVSALTCVVVFCTTYALILPAITMEGTYSCGQEEHVHSEECRIINSQTELTCSPAHSHDEACYGENGSLACGLADFVVHSHNEYCYAEDGTLRCVLLQVTEHSGDEGVYYVIEGSEGPNTTAHIHSDSCYIQVRGQQLCTLTEGEAHIHDAECYDVDQISCTLEEKEGHVHTGDCYTLIQSCADETHTHDDTCYYQELTCGQEEDGHTHTDVCKQPALVCVLSTEPHAHTDSCYELFTETACGKLSLTRHDHTEACVHTETEEILLCEQEEHLHTLICYSDPTADLETAENWEAALQDLELDGTTAENLLSVARTQLGYTESKLNYTVLEDGITQKGYTRYGAWSGTPYADWNELFLEFCLHYAGIEAKDFPRAEENKTWAETLSAHGLTYTTDGTPIPGDLIFLNIEDTDYTGIVTNVSEEYVTVILGDYKNEVRSETFTLSDEDIQLYALLPELEEEESQPVTETQPQSTEEPVTDVYNKPLRADIDLGTLSASQTPENTVAAFSLRSSGIQTYAEEDADTTTYPDMAQFITSAGVYYRNNNQWVPVIDGMSLPEGTQLRYELGYTIPVGKLSATNNIVYYELPVKNANLGKSGYVYSDGGIVGTYVVNESNQMVITYDREFAAENVYKDITGTIFFEASLSDVTNITDGKYLLGTFGGEQYTVTLTEQKESNYDLKVEKTETSGINKETGEVSYTIEVSTEKGTPAEIVLQDWMNNAVLVGGIQVTDSSGNTVSITENPKDGADRFTITLPKLEANGRYTIIYTAKVTNPNQGTTSVYNVAQASSKNGEDSAFGQDDVSSTVEFKDNPLNKTHSVDQDGNVTWTITIDTNVIDPSEWTLSDTMSKDIADVKISYSVIDGNSVIPKEETVELPHTFAKAEYTGPITVTYTSKMDYQLGQSGVYNSATITPPEGEFHPSYSEGESAPYPDGSYSVIDKKLSGEIKDPNTHEPKELKWSLTIGPNYEELESPWTLTDTLSSNQYYTVDQQNKIKTAVADLLEKIYGNELAEEDYTLEFTGSYTKDGETGLLYTGFELTVEKNLPKITAQEAEDFTMTYSSTVDIGSGDTYLYLSNTANFNNKITDIDGAPYNPILNKYGGSGWSTATNPLEMNNGEPPTLIWYVELKITEEMVNKNSDIIITEDVPDDSRLTLSLLKFDWNENYKANLTELEEKNETKIEVQVGNEVCYYTVKKQVEDGDLKYVITVPKELIKSRGDGNKIVLELNFTLPEDYIPSQYPNAEYNVMHDVFTNRVSVSYEGDAPFAEDHQSQVVKDPSITSGGDNDDVEKILKYLGAEDPAKKGQQPYVVQINRNAEDLDPSSDWLFVEDTLTFTNQFDNTGQKIQVALLPETVTVSLYDANGDLYVFDGGVTYDNKVLPVYSGSDIEDAAPVMPGIYATQQSAEPVKDANEKLVGETTKFTIQFYIPDGCFVKLNYTYQFSGSGQVAVNNVANVSALNTNYESEKKDEVKIDNVGVTANVATVNIRKVDANNSARTLPGAVYELYKYVPKKDEYDNAVSDADGNPVYEWQYQAILTSDANGELILSSEEGTTESGQTVAHLIDDETYYYLVEIKAPEVGNIQYVLDEHRHYFLIRNPEIAKHTTVPAPDGFDDGDYYTSGSTILFTNRYSKITREVEKKWLNADGTEMATPPQDQQITIALEQYLTYDNPDPNVKYEYGESRTVYLQVGTNSFLGNVFPKANVMDTFGSITRKDVDENGEVETITSDTIMVGDVLSITYKNLAIDPNTAEEDELPGLMNMTSDANYHIPYTWEKGSMEGRWDYTFRLRVRENSELYGWTYGKEIDTVELSVSPHDPTKPNRGGMEDTTQNGYFETAILTGDKWSHVWSGLDEYKLDDHGRILGYYVYELQEIDTGGSYVTDIIPDPDGRTTTIINKVPSDMDLTVEKKWPNGSANIDNINFTLYQVTHESKPEYVDVAYKVWNRDNDIVYRETTKKLLVGSKARISFDGLWEGIEVNNGVQTKTIWHGEPGSYTDEIEITKEMKSIVVNIPKDLSASAVSLTEVQNGVTQDIGKYTLSAANNWRHVFENLPMEAMVDVTDDQGNVTQKHVYYTYYVAEEELDKFTTTYDVNGNIYSICPTLSPDASGKATATIINTIDTSEVMLKVQKKWVDSSGNEISPPSNAEEINFTLTRVVDTSIKINLCIETVDGNSNVKSTENYEIPLGAAITIKVTGNMYQAKPTLTYNGESISLVEEQVGENDSLSCIYHLTASSSGKIVVNQGWVPWLSEVTYTIPQENTSIPTTPLTASNNWTWTSDWLDPGTYKVQELSGKYPLYAYYLNGTEVTDGQGVVVAGTTGEFVIANKVEQDVTDVTVKKEWQVAGMENTPVEVALYQFSLTTPPDEVFTYGARTDLPDETYRTGRTDATTQTVTFDNLPLFETAANGTTTYYTYHVAETTGGYTTSYSETDDGTIVITNSVQYVLPESGGPGTMMYTLGGLGLCGLAVLGYRPKRRRKEDPTS